jgi:hypothetical protein
MWDESFAVLQGSEGVGGGGWTCDGKGNGADGIDDTECLVRW